MILSCRRAFQALLAFGNEFRKLTSNFRVRSVGSYIVAGGAERASALLGLRPRVPWAVLAVG